MCLSKYLFRFFTEDSKRAYCGIIQNFKGKQRSSFIKIKEKTVDMSKVSQDYTTRSASHSTFVSQPNIVTGKMDWVLKDEDYDYVQEIARSGYGDMLHDTDRNIQYYRGIQAAVAYLKSQGKPVNVLDIGTGTGLLSMMAVRSGADTVTACEAFEPMAECAKKVIEANGMKDKIRLIPKRSTDVLLGEDLLQRANLLVTELFDTELIGEGAIMAYTDAHIRLMEAECVAVPTFSRMFIQPVECELLQSFNTLSPLSLGNGRTMALPGSCSACGGAQSLHDLQVDELESELTFVSDPQEVFRFDFSKRNALAKESHRKISFTPNEQGRVDAFVMWWDLQMDPLGTVWLSCAPRWARDREKVVHAVWRDHWMQAVYYPAAPLTVSKGENFDVFCSHDEYSLRFDTADYKNEQPVASGLHIAFSRRRLGQMNNKKSISIYKAALKKHVTSSTNCLVISEGSLLPLIAASLGANKVFYLDSNPSTQRLLHQILECNKMLDKVKVLDKEPEHMTCEDLDNCQIDLVIAEPFCSAAQLPWEHIYFWYAMSVVRSHLSPAVKILPQRMSIQAMGLQFRDLHKIRTPVGHCEGFDITEFDKLVQSASDDADPELEPQPLWEYPAVAMTAPRQVMELDFTTEREGVGAVHGVVDLQVCRAGSLNGVAFWAEFDFGDGLTINQGVQEDDWRGDKVRWDKFSRQAVHLFPHPQLMQEGSEFKVHFRFLPASGDLSIRLNEDGSGS